VTCRSMAAVELDRIGSSRVSKITITTVWEEDEWTSTVGRGRHVRTYVATTEHGANRVSMTYVRYGGSGPSWTRRAAKGSPWRRGNIRQQWGGDGVLQRFGGGVRNRERETRERCLQLHHLDSGLGCGLRRQGNSGRPVRHRGGFNSQLGKI
jgi:hypothetical protein